MISKSNYNLQAIGEAVCVAVVIIIALIFLTCMLKDLIDSCIKRIKGCPTAQIHKIKCENEV